jgi:hypothetical protein
VVCFISVVAVSHIFENRNIFSTVVYVECSRLIQLSCRCYRYFLIYLFANDPLCSSILHQNPKSDTTRDLSLEGGFVELPSTKRIWMSLPRKCVLCGIKFVLGNKDVKNLINGKHQIHCFVDVSMCRSFC